MKQTLTGMPLFSNLRAKRRTVYMVLLVWLFALASGWANACLLQGRDTHWHGPSDGASLTAQLAHVSPVHVGLHADHAENSDPGKRACLKVCDGGSQSVIKWSSSADLTDAAMAPLPVTHVWPVPLATPARNTDWLALPAPSPGVPLRTRFARLAL